MWLKKINKNQFERISTNPSRRVSRLYDQIVASPLLEINGCHRVDTSGVGVDGETAILVAADNGVQQWVIVRVPCLTKHAGQHKKDHIIYFYVCV